jgi:HD-like signal output (HDOD) protein
MRRRVPGAALEARQDGALWFIVTSSYQTPGGTARTPHSMKLAATPTPPQADPVDALLKSIRIPPRPSLLADLQRELSMDEPAPAAIGRIVASDVGMAGALLKLANSSFFGSKRKAKSIDQAIAFLGINQVAALMTGLLARQAIPAEGAALASFWDTSSRRAQAMLLLSRRLRIGAPDVAHTFGLFCDCGVPLLMARFPDYLASFEAGARDPERACTELENARHSTSHAAIGCLLARNWGLADDVGWAILHHHDVGVLADASTADAVRNLVALSLLAEKAIQSYLGHADSLEWDKGGAAACAYIGLTDGECADLLDAVVEHFHGEHDDDSL